MSAGDGERGSSTGSSGKARFYIVKNGPDADADADLRHSWIEMLGVDLDYLQSLPFAPLGVVQYALYSITGLRGFLSLAHQRETAVSATRVQSRDSPRALDYYYHYQEASDSPTAIPADVLDTRELTTASARASTFRYHVNRRDTACAVSYTDDHNQACHIIPNSSGDPTMTVLSQIRSRDTSTAVLKVDDLRNGLMLNNSMHTGMVEQEFCFLPVPNHIFALDNEGQDELLPTDSSLSLSDLDETMPATVLVTSPHLKPSASNAILGAKMGRPCRLYPGRSLRLGPGVSEHDPDEDEDGEVSCRQPEIWLLDIVLSAFFLCWFGSSVAASVVQDLGRDGEEQISLAIEAARKDEAKAGSEHGRKRKESEGRAEGPSKRHHSSKREADNKENAFARMDRGRQMLAIALAFPSPEALRRLKTEVKEERELQQTTQDRLIDWLDGQMSGGEAATSDYSSRFV